MNIKVSILQSWESFKLNWEFSVELVHVESETCECFVRLFTSLGILLPESELLPSILRAFKLVKSGRNSSETILFYEKSSRIVARSQQQTWRLWHLCVNLWRIRRAIKSILQGGQGLEWFKFAMMHKSHLTWSNNKGRSLWHYVKSWTNVMCQYKEEIALKDLHGYIGTCTMNRQLELAGVVEHE